MSERGPRRLSRRRFLQESAAVTVAFSLAPLARAGEPPPRLPGSLQTNRRLDGWLRLDPDGTVTAFTGKVELGQGIVTALAQIVAEELEVGLERVRMVSGDTTRTPNEGMTSGSRSIEESGTALRFACAEARAILLEAASARLGAAVPELRVEDGTIVGPGGARATYWQLTAEAALKREATAKARPRPASAHRVVGRSTPRLDIPAKVTGGEAYVQDLRLPGMLFGRVVRPPSPRARLASVDERKARALPGVVAVVRDGSFLGVAAEREEQAIAAAEALRGSARWEETSDLPPPPPRLFEHMRRMRSEDSVASEKDGPAPAAAARTLEATYTRPFLAHASIGPSCAVARWRDGRLQVWTHSQGVFPLRGDLAKVLGVPPGDVAVAHRQGSGCYGHNGADDVALDAALVARATPGRPVKLQWMREDEFGWEPYGSAMIVALRAGLDPSGNVVDWRHELWSHTHTTRPGDPAGSNLLAAWHLASPRAPAPPREIPLPAGGADRNAVPLYEFPRHRVLEHLLPEMPVRVSALRTLGAWANVFAIESFMDELAASAGADPVEFRLRHLRDRRARAAIEAVAARAGWRPRERGNGRRGRGVAFARYKNLAAYVAVVAEVEVDGATGAVAVRRVHAVADAGMIVNPDGLANQIEGGVVQSTSWTLHEAVAFDRTRMLAESWSSYPILRMTEVPAVEVSLLDRPEEPPLGAGEASLGPTAGAIANAVANATGRRLRDPPFTPGKVKEALAGDHPPGG